MTDFDEALRRRMESDAQAPVPPFGDVVARVRRRRTARRAGVGVAAALAAAVAAVALVVFDTPSQRAVDPAAPPATVPSDQEPGRSDIRDEAPPWDGEGGLPVFLQLDSKQVRLDPWTYCRPDICADGMPQPPYVDAGDRDVVAFAVPRTGWSFTATVVPLTDARCGRRITMPVERTGRHTFAVPRIGPPDTYRVDLFGRGPEGGSSTSFRWTTDEPGLMPEPTAMVSGVYGGIELSIRGLPDVDRATATVTAMAEGGTRSFGPLTPEAAGCRPPGDLFFDVDNPPGELQRKRPPVTYEVELVLDGRTYRGISRWPTDEMRGEAPFSLVTFQPPLPTWGG
ncbi:hypothetical protein [Nocardioides coralli]|uniref:hypothetical protein n=1 Tax=Nocardioides coralli TaxID=2872154 RepID=UPI001CA43361|nr:hypothetical protein [Nocardioides coralli]QZY27599.1 hypothetical protein K6T13_08660 [Nocardioides coralli]